MHPDPLALFLTWTTYGTWLPGDRRGWSRPGRRHLPEHPLRERAARRRMADEPCLLSHRQRRTVADTVLAHCEVRGWSLHAGVARSNHVHVVLSALGVEPPEVRRQLKAWTTRRLREAEPGRTNWWTEGGDIAFLDSEDDVAGAVEYVRDAQDRKGRDG